jgi:hypothetical protein
MTPAPDAVTGEFKTSIAKSFTWRENQNTKWPLQKAVVDAPSRH